MARPTYNVDNFGARGDGSTNDTSAAQRAYDAIKADGGQVQFSSGKNYVFTSPVQVNRDYTITEGNGATITLGTGWSGSGAFSLYRDGSQFLDYIQFKNIVFDLNSKAGAAISNFDDFVINQDYRMRFGYYSNLYIKNNNPGDHMIEMRHLENKNVFDHCEFHQVNSTNANKSGGLYLEDDGAFAGNSTIRDCKFSCKNTSVESRLLWLNCPANGSQMNRMNVTGNHFFGNNASAASTQHAHGVYMEFHDAGGDYNNKGFFIHHNTIEDLYKAIYISGDNSTTPDSGARFIHVRGNHLENKNDVFTETYESGNTLIHIGESISAKIDHNTMMIKGADNAGATYTFFQCDSDLPVWYLNNEMKKRNAADACVIVKVTGTALDNNPLTLHLGNLVPLTGFFPSTSSTTDRYIPIGGHSTAISTEANVQIKARKPLVLRILTAKPDTNSLTQNTPVSFRVNGANTLSVTIPNTNSITEQASFSSTYREIDIDDLINFRVDFQGTEGGSVRLANVTAWCEEVSDTVDT